MGFEWDPEKAAANELKHGVTFVEGATVFEDPLFLVFEDPDHSFGESRYIIMGRSAQGRLLLVSYTERGNRNRVISARAATKREKRIYEEDL